MRLAIARAAIKRERIRADKAKRDLSAGKLLGKFVPLPDQGPAVFAFSSTLVPRDVAELRFAAEDVRDHLIGEGEAIAAYYLMNITAQIL